MERSRPGDCVTVAVVNDYDLVVAGVAGILKDQPGICVVDLRAGAPLDRPVDVALFDTYGRRNHGLDRVREMAADQRVRHVVVYTFASAGDLGDRAVEAGASGVLSKGMPGPVLARALLRIAAGEVVVAGGRGANHWTVAPEVDGKALTRRQREILVLLAEGMTAAAVARTLLLSENTVKTHIAQILRRLDASNRAQAIARAAEIGLLQRT